MMARNQLVDGKYQLSELTVSHLLRGLHPDMDASLLDECVAEAVQRMEGPLDPPPRPEFISSNLPYDTLADAQDDEALATGVVATLEDLYQRIIGDVMSSEDVVGEMFTGEITLDDFEGDDWGLWYERFGDHPERWFVRCHPRGRMGKPLEPGERRRVSVLIRHAMRSDRAQVTNILLERLPAEPPGRMTAEERDSVAPHGVNIVGIAIFDARDFCSGERVEPHRTGYDPKNKHGHRSLLGSTVALRLGKTGDLRDGVRHRAGFGFTVLAGALAGVDMPLQTADRPFAFLHADRWRRRLDGLHDGLAYRLAAKRGPRAMIEHPAPRDLGVRFFCAAEQIAERYSFAGLLDVMSDPFYKGALPNALYRPHKLCMIMVLAARAACRPAFFGIGADQPADCAPFQDIGKFALPTPNDEYAARQFAVQLDAVLPSRYGYDDFGSVFAIDVALREAVLQQKKNIARIRETGFSDFEAKLGIACRDESPAADTQTPAERNKIVADHLTENLSDYLRALHAAGCAMLTAAFGVPEREAVDRLSDELTQSTKCMDPVTLARYSRMQDLHPPMGALGGSNPPRRQSTRNLQQRTLLRMCIATETWIKDGSFLGKPLDPSGGNGPALAAARAVAVAVQEATLELKNAAGSCASAPRGGSGKKSRKAKKNAREKSTGALSSLSTVGALKEAGSGSVCPMAMEHVLRTLETAFYVARGCPGANSFGMDAYALSKHAKMQCAQCANEVHCIASVAFASPEHARCQHCNRPRCLRCVEKSMARAPLPSQSAAKRGRCLFCAEPPDASDGI